MADLDAVVVGAGPNGLAAALTLVAAGLSVRVVEGADTIGGGCRTAELTEPGVRHDVCSTVHPLAAASPFFTWLGLQGRGVRLLHPAVAFAHPLPAAGAGAVHRSVDETAEGLGSDGRAWRRTFAPLAERADAIVPAGTAPLLGVLSTPGRAVRDASLALGARA